MTSSRRIITCGVPQGSILGPLLFLIYINDLGFISDKICPIMFADDTNVFISGKDPIAIANQINVELNTIVEWLRSNRLSLNIGKTNYMLFSPTRSKPTPELQLKIDGSTLEQVHSCKFLGVLLDDKLTWKAQINHISGKISKSIGVLSKARKYLDRNSLLSLYYTMLYPYLLYCIIAWGKANTGIINPLIKTQKRAIRLMCNLKKKR